MPVARFQMPDGRVARFEVPEGTTPEQAQKMFKGKKLKQTEKPKTFIPGDQLEKLAAAQQQNNFASPQFHQQQQRVERVQPTKEDIEAIRVCIYFFSSHFSIELILNIKKNRWPYLKPNPLKKLNN